METFDQQGPVTVLFQPPVRELAQCQTKALAGEIGAAELLGNHEAAELHDEFETIGTSHGIPPDPSIAILEAFGGPGPTENGDQLDRSILGILFVSSLPENMSCRPTGLQIVFFIKNGAKLTDFKWLGRGANVDGGVSVKRWRTKARGCHDGLTMQKSG
jgi:hypothetical protein